MKRYRNYDSEQIKKIIERYVQRYKEDQENNKTKDYPIFTESSVNKDEKDCVDFVQETID